MRIGLQVHVGVGEPMAKLDEGRLNKKLFCTCPILSRNAEANTSVCPVCSGEPGSIPVLNLRAVRLAIATCRALNCKVAPYVLFDRKAYFFKDVPKNFQITQYSDPIGFGGHIDTSSGRIRVRSLQIEEDPARFHGTAVDLNRCGKMLLEVVLQPDITTASQAVDAVKKVLEMAALVGALDQSGETVFRADVNVSTDVHPRVQIKNLGSFKQIDEAIVAEENRQLSTSEPRVIHTRKYESAFRRTVYSRPKETTEEYRPIPEINLPPIKTQGINPYIHVLVPLSLGGGTYMAASEKVRGRVRGWLRLSGLLDFAKYSKATAYGIDVLSSQLKYRSLTALEIKWNSLEKVLMTGDRTMLRQHLDRVKAKIKL